MKRWGPRGERLKLIASIFLFLLLSSSLFADSFTFGTGIYGVSNGPKDFGMNLLPAATKFGFYHYFNLYKGASFKAKFNVDIEFRLEEVWLGGLYNYETGFPIYLLRSYEREKVKAFYLDGLFFNPNGYIDIYLAESWGVNPVAGEGPLSEVRLGWRTSTFIALDDLNWSIKGSSDVSLFTLPDGKPNPIFGPDKYIQAYPWLSGSRTTWNNYLYLEVFNDFRIQRSFEAYDGVYIEGSVKWGPWWLMNNLSPAFPTSDFLALRFHLEEDLTLYSLKQENGRNWINFAFIHTDNLEYTGGAVVPEGLIPYDRLTSLFHDRFAIRLTGPQFLTDDTFAYMELSLDNRLHFGTVVNESPSLSSVIELESYARLFFHLRLFGFIRFDYEIRYTFFNGIWAEHPSFSQDAAVRFYVSI